VEADWFPAHSLPQVPARISIARQLIDWFVVSQKHNTGHDTSAY
jgi:NAD+ diphosphatase